MTQEEFKAWFEGFCEGISGTPTEKQWKRIQARVKEIDGTRITEHIFVQRYDPLRYWGDRFYCGMTNAVSTQYAAGNMGATAGSVTLSDQPWNSTAAMYSLGTAEAKDAG
jgi:hypothetical protein